jgi:cation-transporting ATPase E
MAGSVIYEATDVGEDTVAQKLTEQARAYRNVRTPLQREVDLILRAMGVLVALLALQTIRTFDQIYDRIPLLESVKAAAVLVALVPQGLVLMIAVTYSLAVMRLAKTGVLIQRLNAVESSSHIDVLCVDKTGTLTTQALELEDVYPVRVTDEECRRLIGVYAASVSDSNKTNDALKTAFPSAASAVGDEVAFDSARKWSALGLSGEPEGVMVLGAPEILAPHVNGYDALTASIDAWADRGLRVLLFACAPGYSAARGADGEPELPRSLQPLAVISIRDQLREGARETIQAFAKIGVQVKVISGDNADTVLALARQCGIPESASAIAGAQLANLDDLEMEEVATTNTVFGRVTPEQKERLVAALTRRGHYVAMTGDGVNDILALKRAKVAIAMRSGSEATRGVADIVLMDDSFSVLPETFSEGQRIMRGMYDVIKLFLTRTLFVAFLILGASLIEVEFPLTPKQNSLLATLTVGIPAFALAIWAVPGRTPRRLLPTIVEFVIPASVVVAAISLSVYEFFLTMTGNTMWAQAAVTTTMVACGLLIVLFAQPPSLAWVGGSSLNGDLRPAAMVVGLFGVYVLVLFVRPVRDFFEITTLPFSGYVMIGFVVAGWAVIVRTLWRWALGRRVIRMWRRRYPRGFSILPSSEASAETVDT